MTSPAAPSDLDPLERVTEQMVSTLDLDEVLAAVTGGLVEDLGAALARIWLVEPSLFESCERAGILFNNHLGSIGESTATKNRFGLVIQGTPVPDVGADNSFVGNTETDRVEAGMLPVP